MKKYIFAAISLSLSLLAGAQTEYDALRLSQSELTGTARYMSLGGAMGALGGDASAMKDNPAALGVYRSTEITGTMNLGLNNNQPITWQGRTTNQESRSDITFQLEHFY